MAHRLAFLSERQAPPPGIPPQVAFDGVEANRQLILGVSIFSIILGTLPVVGRFLSRKNNKLPFLTDDYLIVVALIFANADAACYIWALQYGFGYHIYTLQPTMLVEFFKIVFVTFQFYGAAVTFVKFSILFFYRRVFPNAKFKVWLISLGVASLIWWILISLVAAFECIPVQKAWDDELDGYCIPYLDIFIGIQVANILLDIAILCLPITAIMGLQMSKANKISVAATFGLGGLSIIFAIVRLAILVEDMKQTDITYATPTANWSLIEPSFEIFCACLPCLTPILKAGRYFSKVGSRFSTKKKYGSSSGYSSKNSKDQMSNAGTVSGGFQRIDNESRAGGRSPAFYQQSRPGTSESDVPLSSIAIR